MTAGTQTLSRRAPRVLPLLALAAGLALVGQSLYLGTRQSELLGTGAVAGLFAGPVLLFGGALVLAAYLGRDGRTATVLATMVVLAVGILVAGPSSPFALGIVHWTVLSAALLVCVGLPSLVLIRAGSLNSVGRVRPSPRPN